MDKDKLRDIMIMKNNDNKTMKCPCGCNNKYAKSEETRKKIGEANRGKIRSDDTRKKISKVTKGRTLTPEHKAKISEWSSNRRHSEATRRKMSKSMRGNSNGVGHTLSEEHKMKLNKTGYKHTEEAKAKLRAARMKQKFPVQDTKIEVALQNILKDNGIRFKTHQAVLGITQPDILIGKKIAVYADGCYWHGCESCIDRNKQKPNVRGQKVKDLMITQKLENEGYTVIRLWEHSINADLERCFDMIQKAIGMEEI